MKKILFLGYSKKETKLINFLFKKKKFQIFNISGRTTLKYLKKFDVIISFGYKHIISKEIIKKLKKKIINLHIGFLPFNRGSHPNFWSFLEDTPTGVSIHEMDGGIDTGNLIFRKFIDFKIYKNFKVLTFKKTHKILIGEIEDLFIENHDKIINYRYKSYKQIGKGSFHKKNDLPDILKTWNQNIFKTINKHNNYQKTFLENKLKIITKIENTRKNNNINWMNIVRNSLSLSPKKTLELLKSINQDDQKISKYFKLLNEN